MEFIRCYGNRIGLIETKGESAARDLGIYILGGKGRYGWNTPSQIQRVSNYHGLDGVNLMGSSELTRRVDNNAIMDGYSLYQNYFILSDDGDWTGITQGMNTSNRRARRYHWHSPTLNHLSANHTLVLLAKMKEK